MRALIFTCCASAMLMQADTLYLRDGQPVNGTFIGGTGQTIRFLPDGGRTQTYSLSRVDRISFGDHDSGNSNQASNDRNSNTSNDRNSNNGDRQDRTGPRNDGFRGDNSRARSSSDEVPVGTTVVVRMIDAINSNSTDAGRSYKASLDQDLLVDGRVIASRGSDATVQVVKVDQGRAIGGREEIALQLIDINANGRRLNPVTQDAQISANSRGSENVKVIGGTAALGALIGAIAGGGRGAAIGAASGAGAGAAVQAVRGQKLEVPSETQLTFSLSQPLRY